MLPPIMSQKTDWNSCGCKTPVAQLCLYFLKVMHQIILSSVPRSLPQLQQSMRNLSQF